MSNETAFLIFFAAFCVAITNVVFEINNPDPKPVLIAQLKGK